MTHCTRWFMHLSCLLWAFVLLTHPAQAQQVCTPGHPRTTLDSDFTAAGDGMVQHTPTGLIWKRCAEGQSWDGDSCGGEAASYTWQQAFELVDALNAAGAGTDNLGQTDWRVPNINELKSLVEQGCTDPAINLTQFPNTPASYFWSASPTSGYSTLAWDVHFVNGIDRWHRQSYAGHVRLVRAGRSFLNFDAALGIVKVSKAIAGAAAGNVPADTPFPITLTCGATTLGPINATTAAPAVFTNVLAGDCTVSEGTLPTIAGVTWETSYNPSNSITVTAGANIAVTVTNTANRTTYAVTAVAGPVDGGTVSCTADPVSHGSDTSCTATPNPGYTFSGWSGDCTGTGACDFVNVTSAKSVTASFTRNTYDITATASMADGGTVSCLPNPVTHGSDASCTATPNPGYTFSGWSGDCTGTNCTLSNVTGTRNVTALFTLNNYAITVTVNPAGSGVVTCSPNPVGHGVTATCTATANTGYTFDSYSGACTGATCTLTNVTANQSITASFSQDSYAVTASGGTGGTISPASQTVNDGATTSFTVTPEAGYTASVSGCGGSLVGTTYTTGPITAACTVTASFSAAAPKTYTGATATGTGNATATVTGGGGTCGFSDAQFVPLSSVAAQPSAGYSFPHGLFKFTLTQCTVGSTVTLSIRYPAVLPAGTSYWKYGPTANQAAHWYALSQAAINGDTVTFSLTDGGFGDNDLKADGTISDPNGPGIPNSAGGVADIPTLSEWAMILMSLIFGALIWRRKESQ